MVKQTPKMTALVVSAIRNLREVQGSTPKEILNYVMSEYNASKTTSDAAIQRKLCTALKRGLDYGILKCVHGHYSLNTDPETVAPMDEMVTPMDRGCRGSMKKKRRRRPRVRGGKGCMSRTRRKRRRSSGRKRRRHGRSSKGCKSRRRGRGRRSRKSRRGGKRRGHRRSRRMRHRGKSRCSHQGEDIDMLAKDPVEVRQRENLTGGYTYDRERSHSRGRNSRSRTRSPSHSRSSGSSDREGIEGNRHDGQVE